MDLKERINICKQNKYEMNNFISEYKPFISNVVQKQVGKFVQYGKDDELSIGLMAFEEAIRAYNNDKGPFLSFAENIIKRRLIDFYRKESRNNNIISLNSIYDEQNENEVDITQKKAIESHSYKEESEYRKYEILEMQKELSKWKISFNDLVLASPKQVETKKIYKQIINIIINDKEILDSIINKKVFPIKEIVKMSGMHRKKIERARKYIIAIAIIFAGEYKYIQSFIDWR